MALFFGGCKENNSELQNLIKQAEAGQADSQYRLCRAYISGLDGEQKIQEGLKWCEQAAEQNYPDALNDLGDFYRKGEIVSADIAKANSYYLRSAELGNAYGQFQIGYSYMDGTGIGKDVQKGLEWVEKSANQNNALAQRHLGKIYADGYGVSVNYEIAFEWSSKAAELEDSRAQNDLGLLYKEGKGTSQDYSKAKEWFEKSATQNEKAAYGNLGSLYVSGFGVEKDFAKAGELYKKSGGVSPEVDNYVRKNYERCVGNKDINAQQLEYCLLAAGAGHAKAQATAGSAYWKGVGVPQNYEKAAKWFVKAAEQGDVSAQVMMVAIYTDGKGLPKDLAKAYAWLLTLERKNLSNVDPALTKTIKLMLSAKENFEKAIGEKAVAQGKAIAEDFSAKNF